MISSGIPALDDLTGGGIDHGTATLILGPAGSGKSSIAVQYAIASAGRGEPAALFVFDERLATVFERTRGLGTDLQAIERAGLLEVHQIDPAEIGAGEFAHRVQTAIDGGCKLVVIDSLNGYLHAMASEAQLTVQLHELLSYLANMGVATILVMVQHGLAGPMQTPVDISYLADTLILLRYFDAAGHIRKAISAVKRRSGAHEDAIRELSMGAGGLVVGEPLTQFSGVLTGVPRLVGTSEDIERG